MVAGKRFVFMCPKNLRKEEARSDWVTAQSRKRFLWKPEKVSLTTQNLCEMVAMRMLSCNPSSGEIQTRRVLCLIDQPAYLN